MHYMSRTDTCHDVKINLRAPGALIEAARELAHQEDRSLSALVRLALTERVEASKNNQRPPSLTGADHAETKAVDPAATTTEGEAVA